MRPAPSAHPGAVGGGSSSSPPRASPRTQGTRVTGSADPTTKTDKDNKALKRGTAEVDEDKKEKRMKKQGGTEIVAEDEGDDAERSDRKSWKNYIYRASIIEPCARRQGHKERYERGRRKEMKKDEEAMRNEESGRRRCRRQ